MSRADAGQKQELDSSRIGAGAESLGCHVISIDIDSCKKQRFKLV